MATTTSNHQEFTDKALATANNSQAHINYGTVLSIQGKYEQALQESRIDDSPQSRTIIRQLAIGALLSRTAMPDHLTDFQKLSGCLSVQIL